MPTQKPRFNITLDESVAKILSELSEETRMSMSNLLGELVMEALERREDLALSTIATARDSKKEKIVPHQDAWK